MKTYFIAVQCFLLSIAALAQEFVPNYDESKIPEYELPALLKSKNGESITSTEMWQKSRRTEILQDFETYVYGKIPTEKLDIQSEVLNETTTLSGKATLKEVRITFDRDNKKISMNLLMILPKSAKKTPLFLGLNFYGNHSISDDPAIMLSTSWMMDNKGFGITDHKATEASRGVRQNRWPIEEIIDRGYGLATIYYGDIDPDKNDFSDGIHSLFYKPGQEQPAPNEWGSLAAWAWGLSQAMDYIETEKAIDATRVAVMGHSRLGKATLWAGALDERFAIVISNESGCGGAAISRRKFGESVGRINTAFPHWFCDNFNQYSNNEDALPIDQHMLIALIAPRPVYVASAEGDRWSDPKGEYLSAYLAGDVYKLYGLEGLADAEMPDMNQSVGKQVGYHIRTGVHDVTDFDWTAYMDFADRHFGKK